MIYRVLLCFFIFVLISSCAFFKKRPMPEDALAIPLDTEVEAESVAAMEELPAIPIATTEQLPVEQPLIQNTPSWYSDIESIRNKIWILTEIKIGYGSTVLDRELLKLNQMKDYYSIQFINEGISGCAAPNKYFAPYSLVDGSNIMIHPIASTLIASAPAIGMLDEQKFFSILQDMKRWGESNSILHIYSNNGQNLSDTVMVFTLAK